MSDNVEIINDDEIIEEPINPEHKIIGKIKNYIHNTKPLFDNDLKDELKNYIFLAGSCTVEKQKRNILENKLKNDKFLNKYVEKNIITPTASFFMNDHLRAGLLYAYHISKTKYNQ